MPRPPEHIQEDLSFAYIKAITAAAGYKMDRPDTPEYGIDIVIRPVARMLSGGYVAYGYPLECSVKSSTLCTEKDSVLVYDLKSADYNKLVEREPTNAILLLFRMPHEQNLWLSSSEDYLALRNCCYWHFISGDPTTNTSKRRIEVPRANIFNASALDYLFSFIRNNHGSLKGLE